MFSFISENQTVWYETADEETIYKKAKIMSQNPKTQKASIQLLDSQKIQKNINFTLLQQCSEFKEQTTFDDMVVMDVMNEAEILWNIKKRFLKDQIFSYIGNTLLFLNPYKEISQEFDNETLHLFKNENNNRPHIYALANTAFRQLIKTKKNQAIVISGESGAGKTENAKFCMRFLTCWNSEEEKDAESNVLDEKLPLTPKIDIENKILRCNPILESFGNAKTIRNNNSSRFGKYVRLLLGRRKFKLEGATISNYLLEKSRVTTPTLGERNFHIFYHLLSGCSNDLKKKLNLNDFRATDFNYLNKTNCYIVDTIDDKKLFDEVMLSFETIGFSQSEIESVFLFVCSILHLGNLKFDDSSLTDETPCEIKKENDYDVVKIISELLKINKAQLKESILFKSREVNKQKILSPNNLNDCESNRDALARLFYDRVFLWLVKKLNLTVFPVDEQKSDLKIRKSITRIRNSIFEKESSRLSIGLLDIFGFENFENNSFEQLCINFTNEKLQQLYISYIFKDEENELKNEGLAEYLNAVNFIDNQNIVDLIDRFPNGILDLLDESTALASSSDEILFQKIIKTHSQNPYFQTKKLQNYAFMIVHTAKSVNYNILGFRGKNKDETSMFLQSVIENSNSQLIREIFLGLCGKENELIINKNPSLNVKKEKFLAGKFKGQIKELINELCVCDVHFVRCIKPNEEKKKDFFMDGYILLQIRYLGLLDTIKIRKQGFIVRKKYEDFYSSYKDLDLDVKLQNLGLKNVVEIMIRKRLPDLIGTSVLLGNTKVYLKLTAVEKMEKIIKENLSRKSENASKIVNQFQVYLFKKQLKLGIKGLRLVLKAIIKLQSRRKAFLQRTIFLNKKKAIHTFVEHQNRSTLKFYFHSYRRKAQKLREKNYLKSRFEGFLKFWQYQKLKQLKIVFSLFNDCNKIKVVSINLSNLKKKEIKLEKNLHIAQSSLEAPIKKQQRSKGLTMKKVCFDLKDEHDTNKTDRKEENENKIPDYENENNDKNKNENFENFGFKLETKPTMPLEKESRISTEFLNDSQSPSTTDREINEGRFELNSRLEEIKTSSFNTAVNFTSIPKSADCSFEWNEIDPILLSSIQKIEYKATMGKIVIPRKKLFTQIKTSTLISYQKTIIQNSLTKLNGEEENAAKLCFKYILQFTKDRGCKFSMTTQLLKMFHLVFLYPNLIDEVYLQLCKQSTENTDAVSSSLIFCIIAILSSIFAPSVLILELVLSFLYSKCTQELSKEFHSNEIEFCKYAFRKIQIFFEKGSRLSLPTENQIYLGQHKKKFMLPIQLHDGMRFFLDFEPYTTISEALDKTMKFLNMQEKKDFYGFYFVQKQKNGYKESLLTDDSKYVFDELTRLSMDNQNEGVLYLRIRMYYRFSEKDLDYVNLLYGQIFYEIFMGRILVDEKLMIKLSAISLYVDYGEFEGKNDFKINLSKFLSEKMLVVFNSFHCIESIMQTYQKLKFKYKIHAKINYIELIKDNVLFFSHQFNVKYTELIINENGKSQKGESMDLVLAVKPLALLFLNQKREVLFKYEFSRLLKWGCHNDNLLVINSNDEKTHLLKGNECREIVHLIGKYIDFTIKLIKNK